MEAAAVHRLRQMAASCVPAPRSPLPCVRLFLSDPLCLSTVRLRILCRSLFDHSGLSSNGPRYYLRFTPYDHKSNETLRNDQTNTSIKNSEKDKQQQQQQTKRRRRKRLWRKRLKMGVYI